MAKLSFSCTHTTSSIIQQACNKTKTKKKNNVNKNTGNTLILTKIIIIC